MSHDRRACVAHQKYLEKFTFIKKPKTTLAPLSSPKSFHAEHLFNSWNELKVKQVYSHRQGISFMHDRPTKTSQNQKARFQRNCNRVFNWHKDEPAFTLDDQLICARQHRFLFLESQHIESYQLTNFVHLLI
ncbi:hypothetical protein RhiirA4_486514 [Rhizophagus irregularis]|uniref:DUF8211 domain-containing protein n=1 Tax=Rhizophagus irregularis TaxID=588596 RepID=A0A2I1HRE7_9GLOM|nr:hypothetical protein RhiirA4_486514 [Rhizophagus irregularis]